MRYRYLFVPFTVKTFTELWPLIWITQMVPCVKQELLILAEHPEFVGSVLPIFLFCLLQLLLYSKIQSISTVLCLFYDMNIVFYCLLVRFWWSTFYKNWSLGPFERQYFSILFILCLWKCNFHPSHVQCYLFTCILLMLKKTINQPCLLLIFGDFKILIYFCD